MYEVFTDYRDATEYKAIQIGNQIWMAENLNIGNMIDGGTAQKDNSIIEKYCYSNSEANCDIYGGLYQWNEMMQFKPTDNGTIGMTQGICPSGWHLPTDKEWTSLINYLTVLNHPLDTTRVDPGAKMLISGSNSSGFSGLFGGEYLSYKDFNRLGSLATWWTSTENFDIPYADSTSSYYRSITASRDVVHRLLIEKHQARSVRCVKD